MKTSLFSFLLFTPAIFASPITIAFNGATLTGVAGSTLNAFGNLTNTTPSQQFLNGVSISGLNPQMSVDSSPFFNFTGAPISLAASPGVGSSALNITLFNVTIAVRLALRVLGAGGRVRTDDLPLTRRLRYRCATPAGAYGDQRRGHVRSPADDRV